MAGLDIGRVCVKKRGREAGFKAVIVEAEKDFVVIDGPRIKRRKCNPRHLVPTNATIMIGKGAKHAEVVKLMGKESKGKKERGA